MNTVYEPCTRNPDAELIEAISKLKQCGTCKWWENRYFSEPSDQFAGYCIEPTLSADYSEDDPLIKDETEGQDCATYEERKG